MRFLIFATIFTFVLGLLTLYISQRFIKKLDFNFIYKKYINYFLIFNLFGVMGYMVVRYYPFVPNWLYFLFSIPIGIIFLLFTIAIFYDLSHFFIKKTIKDKKRRDFFKKSLDIVSITAAASINAKAMYNAKNIELEKVNIKINNLKQSYTIAQLSDIHIGGLIDKKFIKDLVNRINKLKVDVVVITGDLVDTNIKFAKPALDELKNFKSKYGTYFIVGNHEYFHNINEIIYTVSNLNIKVLENENIYIGEKNKGFNLAGVYDRFGYRYEDFIPDINKALHNKKNSPTILLAHQPKYLEELKDTTGIDLVLSGHTHGGQLFPFNFLVKLQQPYIRGLYKHNNHTQIYVNKGTGFWGPPMRLGASAEITYIKLEKD